jgi:hypothetical protein
MITPNDIAFGFDYPMGAEREPRAPWNQKDHEHCVRCDELTELLKLNMAGVCDKCARELDEE